MNTDKKISSSQLFISLFASALTIILTQNYKSASFTDALISLALSCAVVLVCFLPSVYIKKRCNSDFITLARHRTPTLGVFVSAFYALYFVYAANYFLLRYGEIFVGGLNPETDVYILTALMLAVCVYAARKGLSALTRCGIFVFAFALIAFAAIFSGNFSNISLADVDMSLSFGGVSDSLSVFFCSAVIAVIFSCTSGKIKNYRARHLALTLISVFVIFALAAFFVCFALGSYGRAQSFQLFALAKTAAAGDMKGFEGVFLPLITVCVFTLISLLLISVNRALSPAPSLKMLSLFAVIIFVLFVCSMNIYSVKEISMNESVFSVLTLIASLVIPAAYITAFGGRKNA